MHIKQKLEYHKQRDTFIGHVNMIPELSQITTPSRTLCCAFFYVAFPHVIKYLWGIFLRKAALELTLHKP
ncbi:hypothetical protein HPB48_004479 [Haemaphysalis longicornis]|uniref:Uncharacterized protein n=1 Tax=Haemaphysalis longicornis TaxID=44386 RepID=A0A9J6G7S9_HAELO|nr:hypothetical protein HPB48_004479 [Haemaphysalis longicornis]